jgi:hypothetical protein
VSERLKIGISQFRARTGASTTWLFGLCLVTALGIAAPSPGRGEERPSFADLLTRAQAQAALGHRWSPPGDNMTETISTMMDLISTATPKQLADLSALLEADSSRAKTQAPKAQVAQPFATEATLEPAPVAPKPPLPIAVEPIAAKPLPGVTLEPIAPLPPPAVALEPVVAKPPPVIALEPVAPKPPPAIALDPVVAKPPPAIAPEPVVPKPPPAIALGAVAAKPPPAPVVLRPSPRALELFARGQNAERQGDVSGARRLYATAAEQGSATAARSLGRLYDPGYLKQTALGGIDPDPVLARHWYERAVAMGDAQAAPLLQALAAR